MVQLPQKHGFAKAARCYLDKLALLCSNTPGCGDISSVVLLQDADSILYVIGSNNRNQQNLEETALFVQSLFKALNVEDSVFQDEGQRSELSAQLMRKILLFHRKRVKVYLNGVANEIKECQRTDEGTKVHYLSPMKVSRICGLYTPMLLPHSTQGILLI